MYARASRRLIAAPLRPPADRRGLTLVEALVAVVVIGIISAIALPRINVDAYNVNGAVRGVTSVLSYAQRLGVSLQHNVVVAFDVPNSRIRVHEDRDNDGIVDGDERVTYTPLSSGVEFGRGPATAHTVGAATVNFTKTQDGFPVVMFRRDGSASETGGFYIIPTRSVARESPHEARAAEIVRATGRVTWSRYLNGVWTRGD